MMKALIYARQSSGKDDFSESVEAQIANCKKLAAKEKLEVIGIYKDLLSLRDQRIFAAVAGKELEEAGYKNDVEPEMPSELMISKYKEFDGRIRAATLDGFEGHIVFESYNDWLIDQREERRKKGIWDPATAPRPFPIGDPDEEMIIGMRAWDKWKKHFSIKRKYVGDVVL